MPLELQGLHHLTAVTADVRGNHRFYTQVLGMRLVKRSVNQDDPSAYHLFYADQVATPGTDLTFFDWDVPRERPGSRSIVRTGLRVASEESLRFWQDRFRRQGVVANEIVPRDGRQILDFEDPEGQRLALVNDDGNGPVNVPWEQSSVPAEHQIRGLGPVTLSVPSLTATDRILTEVINLRRMREYRWPESSAESTHVYEMGSGGPHAEVHVAVQPILAPARPGAGGVHHVAFRTPDEEQYHQWRERLDRLRVANSGEIDRFYFRSLYFREPNGILFEIATDGPGFAVDEDAATLGEKVVLPPFLEPQRQQILANLKPIESSAAMRESDA